MSKTMNGLRRAGTVIGVVLASSAVATSPAWANSSQWPNCTYGQEGWTYWYYNQDANVILPWEMIWEDRNGDLHRQGSNGGIALEGPTRFSIGAIGNHEFAARAIWLMDDSDGHYEPRGTSCEGDPSLANTIDNGLRSAPGDLPGNPTQFHVVVYPPSIGVVDPDVPIEPTA